MGIRAARTDVEEWLRALAAPGVRPPVTGRRDIAHRAVAPHTTAAGPAERRGPHGPGGTADGPGASGSRPGAPTTGAPPLAAGDAPAQPDAGCAVPTSVGPSPHDAVPAARPGPDTPGADRPGAGPWGPDPLHPGRASGGPPRPDTTDGGTERGTERGTGLQAAPADPATSGVSSPYGPRACATAPAVDPWPHLTPVAGTTLDAALAPLLPPFPPATRPDAVPAAAPRDDAPLGVRALPATGAPDPAEVEDLADLLAGLLEDEARALGVLELEP
jgi:hypothetical protein